MRSKQPVFAAVRCFAVLATCCLMFLGASHQRRDREPLYDPLADPFADLQEAKESAQDSGRRVLLIVGGNWCGWCYTLHDYIETNGDVRSRLESGFVALRVNMGPENRNEKFLSQYPEIDAYPFLFVLDADGAFLHAQSTGPLEEGRSYDKAKLVAFLEEWAPH